MTKIEASQLVAVLFASYPSAHLERNNVDAYVTGIIDLSANDANAAVTRLRRTSKFLPSIAEIREACTAQTHGAVRSGESAWGELMQAKRRHGYDYGPIDVQRRLRDPIFGDPLIKQCLTLWGGWNALALADDDAADRARFIALFAGLAGQERQDLTAGKALPLPQRTGPVLAPPLTVAKAEPRAPMPVAELMAALTPERPANRPPSAFAGRKLTAEEIDAALGGAEEQRASGVDAKAKRAK